MPTFLEKPPSAFAAYVGEVVRVIVISLAIILPVRYFLVQPFYVKGASMEPSFYDQEYLIIDELSYRFHEPNRGDIVVFRYPGDPGQFFIKRASGLPGEKMQIAGGRVKIINASNPHGYFLDERDYLGDVYTSGDKMVSLRANEYFVLGDNRHASLDSRIFGPVPQNLIVGRVWVRGWPLDRLTKFDRPDYLN